MKTAFSLFLMVISLLSTTLQSVSQEDLQEYAVKYNDNTLAEILMKYTYDNIHPILNVAMYNKDYFSVILLIEYGVDINSRQGTQPHLNNSHNVESISKTVLEEAVARNEIFLAEYFLSKKADPTNELLFYEQIIDRSRQISYTVHYSTTAVYDAIMEDRLDFLILFAQYDVDLSKVCYEVHYSYGGPVYKKTPIQIASERKNKDILTLLLSIGAEI